MFYFRRVLVGDQERALIARRGRFDTMLGPGAYWLAGPGIAVEMFSLAASPECITPWADYLVKEQPAIVERFFTVIETADSEVAAIYFDGKLARVLAPGRRVLYWRGARTVTSQIFNAKTQPELPAALVTPALRLGSPEVVRADVPAGSVGLLYLEGRYAHALDPGQYGFWTAAQTRVDLVDLRLQTIEAQGQEILTRDKVSLRVNILAEYRVTDAARAAAAVNGWQAHLYRTVQLAVRELLGSRTLDELLADKAGSEQIQPVLAGVRAAMEPLGVDVARIAFKDVILPGEMRDLLNQVVLAEKEAQANLIRRREETAATRSLLNTARLMAENPLVVRLKELETLEKVAGKIDRISVYSGVDGLMRNLVAVGGDAAKA
ncbi:MAG: slipin family protein [Bryobacterales bacterium]|nr:slipin family protein [Bryobacterales bacterium]